SSIFLGVPERSGGSSAALHLAALQGANSGNNMAGGAFQIFLRRAVAVLHEIAGWLSDVQMMREFSGIN
ncbi:MAG: hypothetical protein Q7T08_09275, partial [Devosia sp.]|nr:hypothetical protein [Devosia sp.]